MQDLHGVDPTQEICATIDRADFTDPTRQHELKMTGQREPKIYIIQDRE